MCSYTIWQFRWSLWRWKWKVCHFADHLGLIAVSTPTFQYTGCFSSHEKNSIHWIYWYIYTIFYVYIYTHFARLFRSNRICWPVHRLYYFSEPLNFSELLSVVVNVEDEFFSLCLIGPRRDSNILWVQTGSGYYTLTGQISRWYDCKNLGWNLTILTLKADAWYGGIRALPVTVQESLYQTKRSWIFFPLIYIR